MRKFPPIEGSVSVIGAGSWGTALAHCVANKGYPVKLWVRRAEVAEEINERHTNSQYLKEHQLNRKIQATTDLEEAAQSELLIVAIPSKAFRAMARQLGDFVQPDQILLSATKGIEPQTHQRMSEILKEETASLKVGVISGPNLALEVMSGYPSATLIASRFDEVVALGMQALNTPQFRTYGSHDIVGAELAGALKNVLAIASGIISGMGYGANTRAFLVSRGVSELIRLGHHFDVDPLTLSGLAGVGDIMVTCSSEQSRNFRVGLKIGQGESLSNILSDIQQVAEGVRTSISANELAQRFNEPLPVMQTVYQILHQNLPLQDAAQQLLGREMHFEHQPDNIIQDFAPSGKN